MTSYAPTPADFMRMTDGPDFEAATPAGQAWHEPTPDARADLVDMQRRDELAEVLERLDRIAGMIQAPVELERQVAELHEAYGDVAAARDLNAERIEHALEAIKKSTSKVANQVREILQPEPLAPAPVEPPATPEGQQPDPEDGKGALILRSDKPTTETSTDGPETPEPDADVATWRAYGEQQGLAGVEHLNRSQIRSMLGIPQPVATEGGAA